MQLIDGRPVYAATDLVGYLACDHRLALERAALAGLVEKPIRNDPSIELVAKRGLEHEHRYLEELRERGLRVVEIEKDGSAVGAARRPGPGAAARRRRGAAGRRRADDRGDALRRRRRLPGDVLRRDLARPRGLPPAARPRRRRAGQRLRPVALRGRGHQAGPPRQGLGDPPDLLVRRAADGRPGPRSPSSSTSSSAAANARPTRCGSTTTWPTTGGSRPTSRPRSASAARRGRPCTRRSATYPEPVEHCDVCRWNPACRARRRADDDLSLVAGAALAPAARAQGARRGDPARRWPSCRCRWTRSSRASAPARWSGSGTRRGSRSSPRTGGEVLWELLPLDRGARRRAGAGSRAARPARAAAGRPVPRPRGRPVRARRRHRLPVRHPRAGRARDRSALGARRTARPVPTFHAFWSIDDDGPGHLGGGEGRLRADRRPDHRPARARPGHPRLPLRGLRAHGAGTARAAPRHARGGGRPPPPRRRARRPVQGRSARASGPASRATRSSASSRCTRSSARSS